MASGLVPQPFHVYHASPIQLGTCTDIRPVVVLAVSSRGRLFCVRLSAAFDLFQDHHDFMIRSSDPCFSATGLAKTCFAIGRPVPPDEEAIIVIDASDLIAHKGELTGNLRREFVRWCDDQLGFSP